MSARHTKQIGIVTIGRKRPGFDQQWNEVMRREAAAALRDARRSRRAGGSEIPVGRTDDARCARPPQAARVHDAARPPAVDGQRPARADRRAARAGPVVLWATPERPDGEKVSSCSLVAQHLWSSLMRQLEPPVRVRRRPPDRRRRRRHRSRGASPSPARRRRRAARARHDRLARAGVHRDGGRPVRDAAAARRAAPAT